MFFELDPAESRPEPPTPPPMPPWTMPPANEIGVIVPIQQVVTRGENVVVVLSTARVFSTGCLLEVEIVSRRGDRSQTEWWEQRSAGHSSVFFRGFDNGLTDKMLRFGIRLPDGTKATTLRELNRADSPDTPPDGPVLAWTPSGSRGGGDFAVASHGLWLWPLPPAEPIEFAVEWPFGGIDLTIVEFDGGQITEAAGRSQPYWP